MLWLFQETHHVSVEQSLTGPFFGALNDPNTFPLSVGGELQAKCEEVHCISYI